MDRTQVIPLTAACAFMMMAANVYAIEREMLLLMDIPLVVTASKTEQPINEAPATIEVITAQDIIHYGFRTLADALRTVPGMDMAMLVHTVYFSPRGLNDRRTNSSVLCLIDGHPYNEVTQGTIDPLWVPLSNVKRIEVISGPGSALYGANAFTGVVNIITKDAADIPSPTVTLGFGNDAVNKQEVTGSATFDGQEISGSLWRYYTDSVDHDIISPNDDRTDIKLFAKYKNDCLSISADRYTTDLGVPGVTTAQTLYSRGKATCDFFTADYVLARSKTSEVKLLSHAISTYQKVDDPRLGTLGTIEADSWRLGGELQANHRFNDSASLVSGLEWKHENNKSDKIGGDKNIETKAAYLQGEWRPSGHFIITAGGRNDMPSAYESVFSPRINITWKATDTCTTKLSYGEAFRAPNFLELYANMNLVGIIYLVGNPDLKPERIRTYEAGVSNIFSREFKASLNLFQVDTTDSLILTSALQTGGPNGSYLRMQYSNGISARILGGEASVKYRPWETLETTLSYAYQKGENIQSGLELALAPQHKIIFSFIAHLSERLCLSSNTFYQSSTIDHWDLLSTGNYPATLSSHRITNARVSYDLTAACEVSFAATNLFHETYEEIATCTIGGSTYFTEARYRF